MEEEEGSRQGINGDRRMVGGKMEVEEWQGINGGWQGDKLSEEVSGGLNGGRSVVWGLIE